MITDGFTVHARTTRTLARATVGVGLALLASGCRSASTPGADERAMIATSGSPNILSSAERAAGWRLLFDGRTLRGWRGLGYSGVPAGHWTVEDGAIKKIASATIAAGADGRRPAWDWKMTPVGNSGMKYNVSEELSTGQPSNVLRPATGSPRESHSAIGFEYQMIDDDRHSDGKLPTHRSGALYDLITPSANKRLMPIGEWNHSVIVFNGAHGEHWLNGVKVVEYELGSARLDSALAASKFRTISWYAQRRTGHVVLQDHGDEVWFRNIKLRELRGAR